jgi:hypothetical protein
LLLQEFDLQIKEKKKGAENHVANHLIQLQIKDIHIETVKETFSDEQLYVLHSLQVCLNPRKTSYELMLNIIFGTLLISGNFMWIK